MSFASRLHQARASRALSRARARAFRKTFAELSALSLRDLDDIGVSAHLVRDVAAEASLSVVADPAERVSFASAADYVMAVVDVSIIQIGRFLGSARKADVSRLSSAAQRDIGVDNVQESVVRDLIAARSRGFASQL